MGLIDHDTLHRVMADYAAAFVEPSADLLGLLHRLSDDCVAVLRLAGAGMSLGATPGVLAFVTATDDRNDRLRHALDSRVVVEQAKGVLAAHRGCGVETAFELMRQHARTGRHRVHDVAQEIVRGIIPDVLTRSEDSTTPRDRGDDVRSRNRGHPGRAGVENRQGRP